MPLRDHFHPPFSVRKSWESIHHHWASMIVMRLNSSVLSSRFASEPKVHHGSQIEIDVATYEDDQPQAGYGAAIGNGDTESRTNGGSVATETLNYAPPLPTLSGEVTLSDADTFSVNVYKQNGGWKLVAAVELISPANKDRVAHRRAFATKVAALLQQGVSVVTVDIVTDRSANLHEDIADCLRLPASFDWSPQSGLSAICYRVSRVDGQERLEVWPFELTVGEELPTVPLWLEPLFAVPLELELTYTQVCQSLRIE